MFRNMDRKAKRIGIIGLIAVLVIGIGVGGFLIFGSKNPTAKKDVTVTFDSAGGSAVGSRTLPNGGNLTDVAEPSRPGYVFAGWFYEKGPVNAYRAEDVFVADTTLYAAWVEPVAEADIREYLNDCEPGISFVVRSETTLTNDNLDEYIRFFCVDGQSGETLSVKPQGDGYLLYSEEGFTPGLTYTIEKIDTSGVFFEKAGNEPVTDSGIKAYTFTVFRENVNHVVKNAEPELLSADDVASFEMAGIVANGQTGDARDDGKTIYRAMLVVGDPPYRVGDIVSLGMGDKDVPENQYYRVIGAGSAAGGRYLDLISPNIEEIYSEMEIYYSGEAVTFEEAEDTETIRALEQEMELSLLDSEGYDYMRTAIATGIKSSPTVMKTVSALSDADQQRFEKMSIGDIADMLKNVEVMISIQKSFDASNHENGIRGMVKIATGDITIPLDDKVHLTINLTMTNEITETAYGFIALQDDFSININKGALIENHCNIDFSATIGTGTGEKRINITEEIQNLINSKSDDKTQAIVDSMNSENFFGSDLGYVEIFNKELGKKTVSIYEVLTIQFKLNFHIDIGMRVGLDLNYDSTEIRKVGMCNIEVLTGKSGITTVNQRLASHTHFTATLKGQIGIRAGFKGEINFSVVHLNDVINFGFAIDVGVYEELTGYVRFDYDSATGIAMAGGLKSETGIYVSLEFTWNLFGWKDGLTIASFKFPILTIGAVEFASEFADTQTAITFDTSSYNVKNSGDKDLLKLKYVDFSGGENGVTISVKPASLSEDYAFYVIKDQTGKGSEEDTDYVSIDEDTGMIAIADHAPERLDFTVVVHYTKGCSLFSATNEPITKMIHMTYMKNKVEDSSQKFAASFYAPDGILIERKDYYVGQIPVPPAEDKYEDQVALTRYKLVCWSKPWKEEIKPIYADTDYHLEVEENKRLINFYGKVYDQTTGSYRSGLIASVSTIVGERPVPPSAEEMSAEPGWEFAGWSPEIQKADADRAYTAIYRQDPEYCLCNFYVNGERISGQWVKDGETPVAPDVSAYNTDERVISGWWPALAPATGDYRSYDAVIRKYVRVTFRGLNGEVLSEQRIPAGTTPEVPEIDTVIEGEEDYYEKHFQYWMTDGGTRIGSVYDDTICTPVYENHYFEVTTIFDAGEHAFADGTNRKVFTGTHAPDNVIYLPQVSYDEQGKTYTVDYWQSTETVNGAYIKLYMKDFYVRYKYQLTFEPVFKEGEPITYTVRFDGGDSPVYVSGNYGEVITEDMLSDLEKTSTIENYYYELIDYGLELPYLFGSTLGSNGEPVEYFSTSAHFEYVGVSKTFSFDANGGAFADGETVKTVTAPYGTSCSFEEDPVKQTDPYNTYDFVGWAENPGATSGNDYSHFVINSDRTLFAAYAETPREYTITFDAGEGYFAPATSTIVQTYRYGDSIVPPDDPTRDEDATYRYVFLGWTPDLPYNTTVSGDATYTAEYRAIRIDGAFEETGIIVTDGTTYEDICVNGISGYTYAFDETNLIYTLTITGSGRTFSGTGEDVYVVIDSGVTDVTFENLSISGEYASMDGLLVTTNTTTRLAINISGACALTNTLGDDGARFDRPVQLTGVGSGASLTFGGGIYCASDFDVDTMTVELTGSHTLIENDDGAGENWRFANATVRLTGGVYACTTMQTITIHNTNWIVTSENGVLCDGLVLSGASVVNVTVSGENADGIGVVGDIIFSDFTGTLTVASNHAALPGIAVSTQGDILFLEGGTVVGADGYDLGGAEISVFGGGAYTSFGIEAGGTVVPASSVTVSKDP